MNNDCVYHKHEIEDEFHFGLSSPVYNHIRSVFLPNIDTKSATFDTFYNLFNK